MKLEEFKEWFKIVQSRADNTFLKNRGYLITFGDNPTGVDCGSLDMLSTLNINKDDPLVMALNRAGLPLEESWLLALAHESGHIELNARCIQLGIDPTDPDMQLKAIGLDQDVLKRHDSHKESAIEAFCDANLINQAIEMLGNGWELPVRTLLEVRNYYSSTLGGLDWDEYATQPVLMKSLSEKKGMDPSHAAGIALTSSLKNEPRFKRMLSTSNAIGILVKNAALKIKNSVSLQIKNKLNFRRENLTKTEANQKSEIGRTRGKGTNKKTD